LLLSTHKPYTMSVSKPAIKAIGWTIGALVVIIGSHYVVKLAIAICEHYNFFGL